jgi:NhaA family Na+:H+ antiporter
MSTSDQAPRQNHGVFENFLHSQVASSVVLVLFTVIALMWANSPWAEQYFALSKVRIGVSWNDLVYKHSLAHWVKDGLMAVFFFVVGLEIKRELVVGELSSIRRALLPITAALGGALVPAAIYLYFNAGTPGVRGWGIPMATDIAFALGILSLFGSRVPVGLKVFLAALAIADDMLAVLVIALFYTSQLDLLAIALAGVFLALILGASRLGIGQSWIYLILAVAVWVTLEASGIHATIAGVLVALLVPVKALHEPERSVEAIKGNIAVLERSELSRASLNLDPQQREAVNGISVAAEEIMPPGIYLEQLFHPLQSFVILPLFALFAAGVAFDHQTLDTFPGAVGLGIMVGLFLGKQVGIILFSYLAMRLGGADLPQGTTWAQLWGVSALAGIGFTMSIFIGELAFVDPALIAEAKIGIILASLVSGVVGYLILNKALPRDT